MKEDTKKEYWKPWWEEEWERKREENPFFRKAKKETTSLKLNVLQAQADMVKRELELEKRMPVYLKTQAVEGLMLLRESAYRLKAVADALADDERTVKSPTMDDELRVYLEVASQEARDIFSRNTDTEKATVFVADKPKPAETGPRLALGQKTGGMAGQVGFKKDM